MKILLRSLVLLLLSVAAWPQVTVAPIVQALPQFFDNSGAPCSGCLLDSFSAGTVSPTPTYQDNSGVTPHSNPIVMNSAGRPPANIYITGVSYKFRLRTSAGATLWTSDNVSWVSPLTSFAGITSTGDVVLSQSVSATGGANQSSNNFKICGNYWTGAVSAIDCWIFQDVLGVGANPSTTLTVSHSGSSGAATVVWPSMVFNNLTVSGNVSAGSATVTGNETVGGTLGVTGLTTQSTGEKFAETTAPSCIAGFDFIWGDSATHKLKLCANGGAAGSFTQDTGLTVGQVPKANASGVLVPSGVTDDGTTVDINEQFASKNENNFAVIHVDQYASWALALADCPTAGCTLDGRSINTPTSIGTIDPGTTKAVTVLLGPIAFTLDHFVMRAGLKVIGMGVEDIQGTKIQTTGTTPAFIMPASGVLQSVQGVVLSDFSLFCTAGNTAQDGIFADVSVGNLPAGSNFETSDIRRLTISLCKGSAIHLKGPVAAVTSAVQFLRIADVTFNVPASNTTIGTCVRVEGAVGQITWEDTNCTQQGGSPTETGIFIGASGAGDVVGPYSQWWEGTTIQNMAIGANLSGCDFECTFHNTHLELDLIAFQSNIIAAGVPNQVFLDRGTANGNVAVNAGAGIFFDASSANNNLTGVTIQNWTFSGNVDKFFKGTNGMRAEFKSNNFKTGTQQATTTGGPQGFSTSTATFTTFCTHYAYVNGATGGTITTLSSCLGPGEVLTLFANVTFALGTGGNINLSGNTTPLTIPAGGSVQLINGDVTGSNVWYVVSAIPNKFPSALTLPTGTVSGFATFAGAVGCTTAAAVGAVCQSASNLTWSSTFVDTSYFATCQFDGATTNVPVVTGVLKVSVSQFKVNIAALTAAAATGSVTCTAIHL